MPLTFADVREAHARIKDKINRTPVMTSETLNSHTGARVFFKCENLQKIGAFKARGATNAVFSLTDEEARRGVTTHSSGNHAAAVARAAKLRGIPAHIVVPNNIVKVKRESVERNGGKIIFCEPTPQARQAGADRVVAETGATFIHPYNDLRVMAGQGTYALELLEDVPDLDMILVPVGGGGQISGVAVAAKGVKPTIRVIGVEPEGADYGMRSVREGRIIPMTSANTVADGLRGTLGDLTFAEIRKHVDDMVNVSDPAIIESMRMIWQVMKLVVEPSGAVPYAALLSGRVNAKGKRVGVVLSGGNADLDALPWMKS